MGVRASVAPYAGARSGVPPAQQTLATHRTCPEAVKSTKRLSCRRPVMRALGLLPLAVVLAGLNNGCVGGGGQWAAAADDDSAADGFDAGPLVDDPARYGQRVVQELRARVGAHGDNVLFVVAHIAKTGGSSFFSSLEDRPNNAAGGCAGYQCDACSRSTVGGLSMACGLSAAVVAAANRPIPTHLANCRETNAFCTGVEPSQTWPNFRRLNLVHVHISDRLPEVLAEIERQGQRDRTMVVTLVRDPADRLVSEFYFLRQPTRRRLSAWNFVWSFPAFPGARSHNWEGLTLEDYVRHPAVRDYQFKFLTGHGFYEPARADAEEAFTALLRRWPVLFGVRDDHDALVQFLGRELGFTPATFDTWNNSRQTPPPPQQHRQHDGGAAAPAEASHPEHVGARRREGGGRRGEGGALTRHQRRQPPEEHSKKRRKPVSAARRPIDAQYTRPPLSEVAPGLVAMMRNTSAMDGRLYGFAKAASRAYRGAKEEL